MPSLLFRRRLASPGNWLGICLVPCAVATSRKRTPRRRVRCDRRRHSIGHALLQCVMIYSASCISYHEEYSLVNSQKRGGRCVVESYVIDSSVAVRVCSPGGVTCILWISWCMMEHNQTSKKVLLVWPHDTVFSAAYSGSYSVQKSALTPCQKGALQFTCHHTSLYVSYLMHYFRFNRAVYLVCATLSNLPLCGFLSNFASSTHFGLSTRSWIHCRYLPPSVTRISAGWVHCTMLYAVICVVKLKTDNAHTITIFKYIILLASVFW